MPALETMDLHDLVVLWSATTAVNQFGQYVVSATPVELNGRWVGRQSSMLDHQGNTVAVDATVIVAVDIALGSILWLGGLRKLPDPDNVPKSNLMVVKMFNSTNDLKGRNTRRKVGLMRYNDKLPTS